MLQVLINKDQLWDLIQDGTVCLEFDDDVEPVEGYEVRVKIANLWRSSEKKYIRNTPEALLNAIIPYISAKMPHPIFALGGLENNKKIAVMQEILWKIFMKEIPLEEQDD